MKRCISKLKYRRVRFYQDWAKLSGGYHALQRNAHLFMVPGMYQCLGVQADFFDALAALEGWVENGIPPEAIVATKYTKDESDQACCAQWRYAPSQSKRVTPSKVMSTMPPGILSAHIGVTLRITI